MVKRLNTAAGWLEAWPIVGLVVALAVSGLAFADLTWPLVAHFFILHGAVNGTTVAANGTAAAAAKGTFQAPTSVCPAAKGPQPHANGFEREHTAAASQFTPTALDGINALFAVFVFAFLDGLVKDLFTYVRRACPTGPLPVLKAHASGREVDWTWAQSTSLLKVQRAKQGAFVETSAAALWMAVLAFWSATACQVGLRGGDIDSGTAEALTVAGRGRPVLGVPQLDWLVTPASLWLDWPTPVLSCVGLRRIPATMAVSPCLTRTRRCSAARDGDGGIVGATSSWSSLARFGPRSPSRLVPPRASFPLPPRSPSRLVLPRASLPSRLVPPRAPLTRRRTSCLFDRSR